jgi:glycosyltransferase involved in cell wall biosynthesis
MLVGYGISEVADLLSKEMVKLDHNVTLVTGQTELFPKEYDLITLRPLPLPLVGEYWQSNFLTDIRLAPIVRLLEDSDVVITFDPMHFIGALAKLVCKRPVIMYYFGVTPLNVLSSPTRRAEAMRQRFFWHSSFRFADCIMTNSKYTLMLLPRALQKKAIVVYHGVDHLTSSFTEARKKEFKKELGLSGKKIVLSIGRFSSPYKGMKTMVKVFSKLGTKRKDVALLLLGRNLAGKTLADVPNVRVVTNVSKEFLVKCLAFCDLYSSASLWEGFNIPLAASQANGKPAVAFNVGAHSEVLLNGKTGFLVDTVEEFQDKLEALIESNELRNKMGLAASQHTKAFAWESCGRTVDKLVSNLAVTG